MITRIIARSFQASKFAYSIPKRTPLFALPFYNFSTTHKQQRKDVKEKESQMIEQISNLETVAQQDQFTDKELNKIISDRKEQLKSVIQENKLPTDALLLGLAVTLPLLGGSGYLYSELANQTVSESFLPFFYTFSKAIGLHQCFQSGVHWGFAVQSHDLQTDSINSDSQSRNQFLMACLPVAAALVNTINLVYGIPTEGILSIAPISIMAGTQLFLLGIDLKAVNSGNAPKWYLKLKIIISLICFASYALFAAMYLNHGDQIKKLRKENVDPFRRYLPTDKELLTKEPLQKV